MEKTNSEPDWKILGMLFKAHPWHGVSIGDEAPEVVTAYIEIVPTDTVKYEVDKKTGILKIDRPQRFSNVCPAPYGLVPQTYCGDRVAELFAKRSGYQHLVGDGDPIDICVLTEKSISHSDIILKAAPIGGLSMLDGEEADDKIIAVMRDDVAYGAWKDISDVPPPVIDRLQHYFLTYKRPPDSSKARTEITQVYGRQEALSVIRASHDDYLDRFADVQGTLIEALDR